MESTGVYWIPVFEILEARGFEVVLVNVRDVKHVPGRLVLSAQDLSLALRMLRAFAEHIRAQGGAVVVSPDSRLRHAPVMLD